MSPGQGGGGAAPRNGEVRVKRPLAHHFLIASYIATPLVNLLVVSVFLRLPLPDAAGRIVAGYGPVVAVWLATAPLAGGLLYLLRRISWYVFLAHAGIILAGSVVTLGFHLLGDLSVIPRVPQALFLAGNVLRMCFVGYVLQRDFRSPYLQVISRKFRSRRRRTISQPVLFEGEILWATDISAGGCFVVLSATSRQVGERIRLRLDWAGEALDCAGQIMRRTPRGLGVRFVELSWRDRRALHRMMAGGRDVSPAAGPPAVS
jgi:hypothetical protein